MLFPRGVFEVSSKLGLVDFELALSNKTILSYGSDATISIYRNGLMESNSSYGYLNYPSQWAAPKQEDIGDGFEARMATVSGTVTSGTVDTWLPLTDTLTWTKSPGIAQETFVGTLEIRPTGGDIVLSSTVTLDVYPDALVPDVGSGDSLLLTGPFTLTLYGYIWSGFVGHNPYDTMRDALLDIISQGIGPASRPVWIFNPLTQQLLEGPTYGIIWRDKVPGGVARFAITTTNSAAQPDYPITSTMYDEAGE